MLQDFAKEAREGEGDKVSLETTYRESFLLNFRGGSSGTRGGGGNQPQYFGGCHATHFACSNVLAWGVLGKHQIMLHFKRSTLLNFYRTKVRKVRLVAYMLRREREGEVGRHLLRSPLSSSASWLILNALPHISVASAQLALRLHPSPASLAWVRRTPRRRLDVPCWRTRGHRNSR